jgi:hypothetical protein
MSAARIFSVLPSVTGQRQRLVAAISAEPDRFIVARNF